jgi:hypothetical protein
LHIQYQTVKQSMRLSHDSIVVSAAVEPALSRYPRCFQLYPHDKLLRKDTLGVCPDSTGNDIWHRYKEMKSGGKIWQAWKHRSVISAGKQLISIYRE